MLENLIEIARLKENVYLLNALLEIKKTLDKNPNDFILGQELRKLLNT